MLATTVGVCGFILRQTLRKVLAQILGGRLPPAVVAIGLGLVALLVCGALTVSAWQSGLTARAAGMELLFSYVGAAVFGTTVVCGLLLQVSLFPEQIGTLRKELLVLPIPRVAVRLGALVPALIAPALVSVLGLLAAVTFCIAIGGPPRGSGTVVLLNSALAAGCFGLGLLLCSVWCARTRGGWLMTPGMVRLVAISSVVVAVAALALPFYTLLSSRAPAALSAISSVLPVDWVLRQEQPLTTGSALPILAAALGILALTVFLSQRFTITSAALSGRAGRPPAGTGRSSVLARRVLPGMALLVHRNSPHTVETVLYALLSLGACLVAARMLAYGLVSEPRWAVAIAGFCAALAAQGVVPGTSPWPLLQRLGLRRQQLVRNNMAISLLWTALAAVPSAGALAALGVLDQLWPHLVVALVAGALSSMVSGVLVRAGGASALGRVVMMCCACAVFALLLAAQQALLAVGLPPLLTALLLVAGVLALPHVLSPRRRVSSPSS